MMTRSILFFYPPFPVERDTQSRGKNIFTNLVRKKKTRRRRRWKRATICESTAFLSRRLYVSDLWTNTKLVGAISLRATNWGSVAFGQPPPPLLMLWQKSGGRKWVLSASRIQSCVWLRDLFLLSWFIDAVSHWFESYTLIRLFSVHCNTIIIFRLAQMPCEPSSFVNNASAQPGFNTFPICVSSVNGTLENCDLFAPVMMRHRDAISWRSFISMSSCWPSSVLMSTLH